MPVRTVQVGSILKGIVAGKSVKTLERPPQGDELGILKVSAVTWGEFRPGESKAMPADYDPGDCPRPMDGDILISRANTRELVGAPVMVSGDHPQLLLSDKLLKLIPDEAAIDRRYLVRALRFPGVMAHFAQRAGGSSGSMTNITQDDIRAAVIALPDLQEQRRIAAILDQADALRAKRREVLAQLDSLTQSIFIEMFGDPLANPMGWKSMPLTQACHCYSGGTPSKANLAYWAGEIPWFSAKDLKQSDLFDSIDHIATEVIEQTSLRLLPENTVVIVVRGMILAHTFPVCVLRVPATVNQDLKALLPRVALRPQFLAACLRAQSASVLALVSEAGHGTKRLDVDGLGAVRVLLPAEDLQDEFDKRVSRVGKLREQQQRGLSELDALFASLQHRAFRGEL